MPDPTPASSSTSSATAAIVPTGKGGVPAPDQTVAATPMTGGGLLLSPLPLGGGKRRKGTRRLSKKVLKMLKAMPKKKLAKMMKGAGPEEFETATGGKSKPKTARKSRRSTLMY